MSHARLVVAAGLAAAAAVMLPASGTTTSVPPCWTGWPMFQHDTSRTGSACAVRITKLSTPGLVPFWFVRTAGAVTAEPAVVGDTLYDGDSTGIFYAIDVFTHAIRWTFNALNNPQHSDKHETSYGTFVSSPAVATVPGIGPTVFVGGGGTLYALDATSGAVRWFRDVNAKHLTSHMEIESSPIVWTPPGGTQTVYVGMDTNESSGNGDGGVAAFDTRTGGLKWKYDAEAETVVHSLTFHDTLGTGAGDVWSSPSIDTTTGILYFGIGNRDLPNGGDTEQVFAIRASDGQRVWKFNEPTANHTGDNDFGGTVNIFTGKDGRRLVAQAGKSGFVYVLDAKTGTIVRSVKVAVSGGISGFIGSTAIGTVRGHTVLFGNTAIPASPTANIIKHPGYYTSLHAVDLDTGKVMWHQPAQPPAYSPVTFANGVVFAASTVGFAVNAYESLTGAPLWHAPQAAAPSGGVAIDERSAAVYFGVGTFFAPNVPPQLTGIWAYNLELPA